MRVKILLISYIMCISSAALSQISGVFSLNVIGAINTDCKIYLYQNGIYEIMLEEQETDDMVLNILISYGNYTLEKDTINLIDVYNGYKMLFIYHNNYIISQKTFNWFVNKKFVKSEFQIWDTPTFTKIKINSLQKERLDFKHLNKVDNPFHFGIFKNEHGFNLIIKSNNKYWLEYKKIILSEGNWSRKNNELILYDTTLHYPFYILIDKNTLINKFLPGVYKGNTFLKK